MTNYENPQGSERIAMGIKNTNTKTDDTNKINLSEVKNEFIKLALRGAITPSHCLVILRRTGLWEI